MNTVGIDVSKGKSIVSVICPFGELVAKPYETTVSRSSKCNSPELRKTLLILMTILLQKAPPDDPVFQFLDKKRYEGKPYYVYMATGCNKFLRTYWSGLEST